jgi:type IV secretory pathway VirB4 component
MSGVDELGRSGPIQPNAIGPVHEGPNFMVVGKPGSGKSALVSQLLAELERQAIQKTGG